MKPRPLAGKRSANAVRSASGQKNAGGARKLRHVLTIERHGDRAPLPDFSHRGWERSLKQPDASAGVATMKFVRPQAASTTVRRALWRALAEGQSPTGGGTARERKETRQ